MFGQIDCVVENNSTGYKAIATSGDIGGDWVNELYYLHMENYDFEEYQTTRYDYSIYGGEDIDGYWIASPGAMFDENDEYYSSSSDELFKVYGLSDGGCLNGCNTVNNDSTKIRPIVSIPLSKIGNGITITNNYY